jgi:hypothetical protein
MPEMNYDNVMIDLETLGKNSHSAIISIGAAEFNASGLGRTFYANIDPESCVRAGLKMDASTVMWWMQQSEQARAAFNADAKSSLLRALTDFCDWFPDKACVWGNGATFDNVILSNAYDLTSIAKPWKYNADRCYRTLKALYPGVTPDLRGGTYHNALDDAVHQAQHAAKILRHITLTK